MTSFKDNLQINSMTFAFSLLYIRLDIFLKVKPWEFIGRLFHKSRKFNFPSLISPTDTQILAKLWRLIETLGQQCTDNGCQNFK